MQEQRRTVEPHQVLAALQLVQQVVDRLGLPRAPAGPVWTVAEAQTQERDREEDEAFERAVDKARHRPFLREELLLVRVVDRSAPQKTGA